MMLPSVALNALLKSLDRPGILEAGVCAETDPELFFPEKGEMHKVRIAKGLCARCQVRIECRDYAVSRGEPFGIWGGTTGLERRQLRAAARRRSAA